MSRRTHVQYENNPLIIGIEGLKLIFSNARSIGIYSIVLTAMLFIIGITVYIISAVINALTHTDQVNSVSYSNSIDPVMVLLGLMGGLIGLLLYLIVSLLFFGVLDYAAARTAKGHTVTLTEAYKAVWSVFPEYLWLYILLIIRVFLWSLLFILPGIVMLYRYILSGPVFFAEGKRGSAAIRRSSELTRGAWLTTYAGFGSWNLISQGIAGLVFWPGTAAILYRQLSDKTDHKEPKPPAHILSWLTLLIPIVIFILYLMLIGTLIAVITLSMVAP